MSESQIYWEADKMLRVYIYEYLIKRKLHASAQAFRTEGEVSTDLRAVDSPSGFLFEWWFWDIVINRRNEKHLETAASHIQTQLAKALELQQQRSTKTHQIQMQQQQCTKTQQMQMQQQQCTKTQQMQMQQQQHQRRDSNQHLNECAGGLTTNDVARHNPRAGGAEGSLVGVPGSNQEGNHLTLTGWFFMGLNQIIFKAKQRLMQSPQPQTNFQLQQQIILEAQQRLASPSISDSERRLLMIYLEYLNMALGKDSSMSSSDIIGNIGSPVQVGNPMLSQGDADMLLKLQQQQLQSSNQQQQQLQSSNQQQQQLQSSNQQQQQLQSSNQQQQQIQSSNQQQQQIQSSNQQQQQYPQQPLSSQQLQNSNHQLQQKDKIIGSGDGSMSNTFQGNRQASQSKITQKRKQPRNSSGSAYRSGSGTAKTARPSTSPLLSPSTHAPGDAISTSAMSSSGSCATSSLIFCDGLGSLASSPNELADMDHFVDDAMVDSLFAQDPAESIDIAGLSSDDSEGISLSKIWTIPPSTSMVECCHFSSDGKLLATGGLDKKVTLWCTESFTVRATLEGHSQWITDVRFGPFKPLLATSSADKTVRVWDADNPGYSLRTFTGHSTPVMSVDYHPGIEDLICSCDYNGEIRYWSIKNGSCIGILKGVATQIRFQPLFGKTLAIAAENAVSIVETRTQVCQLKLQGHENNVKSLCWDLCGQYLASVSADMVRVWRFQSGSKVELIHVWKCSGIKFHTCTFHHTLPFVLIIGCYKTLELWNFTEKTIMTIPAHDKLVSVSNASYLVASASHDEFIKIWK